MFRKYNSELGENHIFTATSITARYDKWSGKWEVRTRRELKGSGIEPNGHDGANRNQYRISQRAFDKICKENDVDEEKPL